MCGIVGKLNFDREAPVTEAEIRAMLAPIKHRGPDGNGVYVNGQVGLGHCRLSIIDVVAGQQPMCNEDGTVWITFNGEIYNYKSLRSQLLSKGHTFKTNCDTEVIVHLYEEFGDACVNQLTGMFAFAIWDQRKQHLCIARDRVGIKPVYYTTTSQSISFASEIKALITSNSVSRSIDLESLRQSLAFLYTPGKNTLLRNVKKLLPGHIITCDGDDIIEHQYWDLKFTNDRATCQESESIAELRDLLSTSIRDHLIADVPVGILLSGGLDSTAVLSYAAEHSGRKLSTFTVGFDDNSVIDERPYAKLAARSAGTDHFDITLSADDFWNFLPDYVWHMEEPVCEPPAVALYYVSRLAAQHVKVVLSGEGGDESFGGYPNYVRTIQLARIGQALGPLARSAGAMTAAIGQLIGSRRVIKSGYALGRELADSYLSRSSDPTSFFNAQRSNFYTPSFIAATSSTTPQAYMHAILAGTCEWPQLNRALYADTKTWLPDDLLIKADKMTMANSLELRVPLLDHRLLEFAASLHPNQKVKRRETKRILKTAVADRVPPAIINRRKVGFPLPYGRWITSTFRKCAHDLLSSQAFINRGYISKAGIDTLFKANSKGAYAKEVFTLTCLELWHQKFVDSRETQKAHSVR